MYNVIIEISCKTYENKKQNSPVFMANGKPALNVTISILLCRFDWYTNLFSYNTAWFSCLNFCGTSFNLYNAPKTNPVTLPAHVAFKTDCTSLVGYPFLCKVNIVIMC